MEINRKDEELKVMKTKQIMMEERMNKYQKQAEELELDYMGDKRVFQIESRNLDHYKANQIQLVIITLYSINRSTEASNTRKSSADYKRKSTNIRSVQRKSRGARNTIRRES